MTPEQLNELAALKAALKQHIDEAEKATPGPWKAKGYGFGVKAGDVGFCHGFQDDCDGTENGKANATFIARARTMSPLACEIALEWIEELESSAQIKGPESVSNAVARYKLRYILSLWKGGQP